MVCSGTGHKPVIYGTDRIFRDAATPLCGAPNLDARGSCAAGPARLHNEFYMHMRGNALVWNSDTGSDELLAGDESRAWSPSSEAVRPLFTNLRLNNRNKAHAFCRIIKRPWFANTELNFVHSTFGCMMSVIQHNNVLRKWYQEFQSECIGGHATDSGRQTITVQPYSAWCAPRFDSFAMALGIAVPHLAPWF
eukprot:NODE_7161_length_1603_cov_1.829268.p1 GENE.NODE_7161_length_1603_cov_1.829268~~NODE_7161_length_1603_cov_1.829268.p1  ORF type:complete len:193 (-),score=6.33 NODE_7161_length_1603_cov_1.829268:367-945(-)